MKLGWRRWLWEAHTGIFGGDRLHVSLQETKCKVQLQRYRLLSGGDKLSELRCKREKRSEQRKKQSEGFEKRSDGEKKCALRSEHTKIKHQ